MKEWFCKINVFHLCIHMQVYDNSLETFFDNFEDLVTTFPLFLGKGDHSREETTMDDVGKLKVC